MKFSLLLMKINRKIKQHGPDVNEIRLCGATIGKDCHIYGSVDSGHEFLVTMGDNVTLASGSRILTHDGSTKNIVGYSRVGRVDIGNDVFIGSDAIVLPNVKIGNKVIIGAGTIVNRDIPDNSVAVGNPVRIVGTYDDYVKKTEEQFKTLPVWHTPYKNKTKEEKEEMKKILLDTGYGFDL